MAKRSGGLASRWDRSVMKKKCQELVGSVLETMTASEKNAEEYLTNPDPNCRKVACAVLLFFWKPNDSFKRWCETACTSDPEPAVRKSALVALGIIYSGTKDQRIAKALASIVRDNSKDVRFRLVAYRSLRRVMDTPFLGVEQELEILDAPDLEIIDWALVDNVIK